MNDKKMVNTTIKDLKGADLMVYLCNDKFKIDGIIGVACLASVCDTRKYGAEGTPYAETEHAGYKHSITEYDKVGIAATSWVRFFSGRASTFVKNIFQASNTVKQMSTWIFKGGLP